MKKRTAFICLLLATLMLAFSACTPSDETGQLQNTEGIQNSEQEHKTPPMLIQLKSKEDFETLYHALTLDTEQLEEFLDKNHYSMNGIRNKEELQTFWNKTVEVPLPNVSNDTGVTAFCLQYYPETLEYILWYTLGGRQYRYHYKEGPLTATEINATPVYTGELYGTQIALREFGEGSAWEYGADFRIGEYNVTLWVRNALGVTDPGPLSLNFAKEPWVSYDQAGEISFHVATE